MKRKWEWRTEEHPNNWWTLGSKRERSPHYILHMLHIILFIFVHTKYLYDIFQYNFRMWWLLIFNPPKSNWWVSSTVLRTFIPLRWECVHSWFMCIIVYRLLVLSSDVGFSSSVELFIMSYELNVERTWEDWTLMDKYYIIFIFLYIVDTCYCKL